MILSSPFPVVVRPPDRHARTGGGWHARRSTAKGRPRRHEGIDALAVVDTPFLCPVGALFARIVDPYSDKRDDVLSGLLLRIAPGFELRFLYVDPIKELVGQYVGRGTVLGTVQSLQDMYPGILDHVHCEVWLNGRRVDPTPYLVSPL